MRFADQASIFLREPLAILLMIISLVVQIKLYNSMVDKDSTDGEVEAMKAYKAAHDESEDGAEVPESNMVSSALIDKVCLILSSPWKLTQKKKKHNVVITINNPPACGSELRRNQTCSGISHAAEMK